jgi:hypothetical protein
MKPPKIGARVYDLRRQLAGEVVSIGRKVVVCRLACGRKWHADRCDLRCVSVAALVPYQFKRKENVGC